MTNLPYLIGATALICGVAVIASGAGDEGRMPDLNGAVAWLNSPPLSNKALRGKVVLVNFWTYSCINSLQRTAVHESLGCEIQRCRAGGDRRPCAGVRFRERSGQREECRG